MRLWPRRKLTYEQATPHLDECRRIIDEHQPRLLHAGWLDVTATTGGWQAEICPRGRSRYKVGPVHADPADAAREFATFPHREPSESCYWYDGCRCAEAHQTST